MIQAPGCSFWRQVWTPLPLFLIFCEYVPFFPINAISGSFATREKELRGKTCITNHLGQNSMADAELNLLNSVELRLAAADNEEALGKVIAHFLVPVLNKLASPHDASKKKV